MKIKIHPLLCALSMSIMLSACGGGDSSALENTRNVLNGTSTTVTTDSSGGAVDTTSPQKLGKGSGTSFVNGEIEVSGDLINSMLAAGGTAVLTVNVVSSTNNLVTTPLDITFSSDCKEAILKSGTTATNQVTTTNGSATIDYVANGCVGDVNVYASTSIDSKVVNAKVVLPISADTVQSIKFIDTTPAQISLKGTGGDETSLVRFQVLGNTGAPIKDIEVDFKLSNAVGDMKLTKTSSTTDKNGYASTTVQAGNIHTTVRVTATAKLAGIFTTSSQLIISTGIPDQDSMSLGATDSHPIGWNIDGVESTLTIRLADAFNNPPPANTNVAFRTEGGSIIDGCLTDAKGACSVIWTSQNPRPARSTASPDTVLRRLCVDNTGADVVDYDACRLERAGRITVLATAIGNESLTDINGNGAFDDGEFNLIDDLPEAYLDKNENNIRDTDEEFVDFTSTAVEGEPDNVYTLGNGIYNGILCLVEGPTCTKNQVTIRQSVTLVMTSSFVLTDAGGLPFIEDSLTVGLKPTKASTRFLLADLNGHGAGAGTTLTLDTASLQNASATITQPGPLLASDDPQWVGVTVTATSTTDVPSGTFKIQIKTPTVGGDITFGQIISVNP